MPGKPQRNLTVGVHLLSVPANDRVEKSICTEALCLHGFAIVGRFHFRVECFQNGIFARRSGYFKLKERVGSVSMWERCLRPNQGDFR